jgi:hypothetical protein
MKRTDLLLATAGFLALGFARAQTPCPPPQFGVEGGSSATTTCPSGTGNYTTSFDLTENPLSEGGRWITGKLVGLDWNNPLTESGHVRASVRSGLTGNRYDDSIAHLSDSFVDFSPNQYVQATVYRAPGYAPSGSKHEVELLLRFAIAAHNARGYEVLWGWDGDFAVVRWNGPLGNYTTLYSNFLEQLVDGDVVRAEINGSTIRVYKNGVLKAAPTDGTFSDGQPGIGFWPVDSSTPANYGWKDVAAGNL